MVVLAKDVRIGDKFYDSFHDELFQVSHIDKVEQTTLYHFWAFPVNRPRASTMIFTKEYDDHLELRN
ncbi:hypothetical protein ANANSI_84 [Arthrobacter phage Anansi]|uniref:Uncharacterized protein n=3 Tax=Amigovirus amigo TaxID=1982100 RepID=A0A0U4IIL3_9CAUD|nr:hypothetical protein ANANSI_84 [Arthrobacter phage Anansi]ALY09141.1 hypothetical protein GORGEOUS_84 [Arthrobacter phage Gorgeous]ALY10422.1 hypothetical protein SORJUANA_84 [Arthrobacter phage SorJuana]